MADLALRIEKLVGRLGGGRDGGAARPAGGAAPALRPGALGFAEAITRLVAMPLDRYACGGQLLEVRVPWLDVTLWFVPDERDAVAPGREGVSRGRVWTGEELSRVMSMASRVDGVVRTTSIAKATVDGEVVEIRAGDPRPGRGPTGSEQTEGRTAYSARQGQTT